jgi:hypothetical protein
MVDIWTRDGWLGSKGGWGDLFSVLAFMVHTTRIQGVKDDAYFFVIRFNVLQILTRSIFC